MRACRVVSPSTPGQLLPAHKQAGPAWPATLQPEPLPRSPQSIQHVGDPLSSSGLSLIHLSFSKGTRICGRWVRPWTYFGDHFTIMGRVSPEKASFEAMQRWAFYSGICLAALLSLGSVLSALATVREAGGLMAGGFLSFALVFCALVQLAYWRLHNPTQVEDALLDAYDALYEQSLRSGPGGGPQELVAIQEVFQCCGKTSPLGHLESTEEHLCRDVPGRQDCLQGIRNFLRTHGSMASALTGLGLATTAYALLLCSFLWLAIRSGSGLDRRGQYALSPRACTRQLRQPSFFRRIPEEPVPHSWPEVGTAPRHATWPS